MKRELAYALEAQSLLAGSVGRTRASKPQPCDGSSDRLKSLTDNKAESNGLVDPSEESGVRFSQCNGLSVYRRNKRFKTARSAGEVVILEKPKGNVLTPVEIKEERKVEKLADEQSCEVEYDVQTVTEENIELENDVPILTEKSDEEKRYMPREIPSRFTRSALKSKVETEAEDSGLAMPEGVKDLVVLEAERSENGAVSVSGTPTKEFLMQMSENTEVNGKPTTVRELFKTGLLEGYPVFYYGGKKLQETALRGTIKGIGILCYCSLCKGSRVLSPCQFEIHACKSYRRAAQYICLENGKSLLQVVKECQNSSFQTLEEMARRVIGPLSTNDNTVCPNCKALDEAQLCNCRVDSMKLPSSPNATTCVKTRSSKAVLSLRSSSSAENHLSSEDNGRVKTKRKSSEPAVSPKSSGSVSVGIRSQKKCQLKITRKSSIPALVPRCCGSTPLHLSSKKNHKKILKKLSKSAPVPRPPKSVSMSLSPQNKSQWKITKKDLRLHKLVFEEGGLPDGAEVTYYSRGKKLLVGYKRGSGIICHCCNSEVSPSQFEAHAGWASRRKPYQYIYTSNGVSLHELAISLLKGRKHSAKDNDDLCAICADGGNLLLCDICPRAFHKDCASLSSVPRGKWYCKYCQNMFQREKFVEHNANAVAAGRILGVDPIERCIRIVKTPEEAEVIACVLCRGYDFSKSGFGPRTVILCDQCEKEYHVGCLKKHKMADLKELPKEKWFCCTDCKRIYSALQNLLICGAEKLPDSLLDVIRKKDKDIGLSVASDFDVRWRLLSGKLASRETRLFLSEAVSIFHECFNPIVDSATGRDFIPSMVYGRNIRGQDFGGMYCAILTVNSSVVSVGILRIFGQDVAELPLVATRNGSQGKGYFQLLFSCIEKLLAFLNVKSFVLPAAYEAESIWIDKFGFRKITPEQLINYRRRCWQMVTFKGTSMLEKAVPQCRIIRRDVAFNGSV